MQRFISLVSSPFALLTATSLALSIFSSASDASASDAKPQTPTNTTSQAAIAENLRCEYLANPLSVDAAQPRLSWTIRANTRGWIQSAYHVRVASSAELLGKNQADLWDSGKVSSSRTLGVRYQGKPLGSGARAFWRVQVWDGSGHPSAPSEVQFWGMGLLRASDWKAQWISAQTPRDVTAEGMALAPAPFLRKTFRLSKPIERATLFATARGVYELRLNGAKVGDEMLAPGWTDYRIRIQHQGYDVTRQLKRGDNVIGAVLGDGWFSGHVGWGKQHHHYGDTPALLAQLEVQYQDGTREVVGSDQTWQGDTGPIVYSDMLMGEMYDARMVQNDWDTTGFKADGWKAAVIAPAIPSAGGTVDVTSQLKAAVKNNALSVVVGNDIAGDPAYNTVKSLRIEYSIDGVKRTRTLAEKETLRIPEAGETPGKLLIQNATYGNLPAKTPTKPTMLVGTRDPAIRVTQELKPAKMTQPTPGTYIFDMGQNMVGMARLRVRGAAGTRVQLRFAEMLNPDGTAYTANLRLARATDTYICNGNGTETWEPRFTFHGFRYVEVTGFPGTPTLDAITGRVIGSDIRKTGWFKCSSPLVNQLQSNIDWGQRGNFLSVPTDCPQRDERLGWMGDAQIFARTATYNRDVAAFFEKWLQDVEDSQAPDGGFPDVAPRKVDEANGAPAWGDAGVIVPWTVYQAYGDKEVIDRHWNAMARWINYISEANPDGLWTARRANDFGDWLSIGADTPKDVLATAYYAYDASLMARMARATNRVLEADKYDALFEHIKSAFNTAFVSNDGQVKGQTQTSYILALRFNLLPAALRPLTAQHLVADIAAKNDHLSTGFVGVGYLCPTLSDSGHNDVAFKLLQNDTFPSWGFSIRQGATTIWERWDGWTPDKGFQDVGMNSFNHYSLGSVGEWLYSHVAGISSDPQHPGFEHILIQPHPGPGLSFADATYDSIRGRIESHWKRENGTFTLEVSVPANTSATVRFPAADANRVLESGKTLENAEGVRFVRQENGDAIFQVGSGVYKFTTGAQ